jgi:hypothetical protein
MARIMSFVTVVFILVPVAQLWVNSFLIITIGMDFLYSGVHQYFGFLVVWKRQPRTLSVDNKKNFQQKVL